MTILELLVTFAVIAVVVSLVLPAIMSARESARDIQCRNNLKQVGLALHSFHDTHRALPIGWQRDSSHQSAFGWASQLLPQLEESVLKGRIDFCSPVSSATNSDARTNVLTVLLCPSDNPLRQFTLHSEDHPLGAASTLAGDVRNGPDATPIRLPGANYVGVFGTVDPDVFPNKPGDGAFMQDRAVRFADFVRGQSNTFAVGERTARKLPSTWLGVVMSGEDAPGRVTGFVNKGPNQVGSDECEFDSRHISHVNFLFADGHVSPIHDDIDRAVYQQMGKRQ